MEGCHQGTPFCRGDRGKYWSFEDSRHTSSLVGDGTSKEPFTGLCTLAIIAIILASLLQSSLLVCRRFMKVTIIKGNNNTVNQNIPCPPSSDTQAISGAALTQTKQEVRSSHQYVYASFASSSTSSGIDINDALSFLFPSPDCILPE